MVQGVETDGEKEKQAKRLGIGCAVLLGLILLVGMCGVDEAGEDDGATAEAAAIDTELGKAEASQWILSVLTHSGGCDSRMAEVGAAMSALGEGRGDRYEGYTAAQEAQQSCKAVWLSYDDIEVPAALEEWEDDAEKARDACKMAAYSTADAAEKSMTLFDGDMRPSVINGITSDLDMANSDSLTCAGGIAAIASEAGIELDEVLPGGSE